MKSVTNEKVTLNFNNKKMMRTVLHPQYIQKRTCVNAANERQKRILDFLPKIETNDDIKTIMDIDPDFYKIVSGRPIKQCKSIREYSESLRTSAIRKISRKYFQEEIARLEKDMNEEKMYFDNVLRQFEQCKQSFDAYLAEDHTKTMKVGKKSASFFKELSKTNDEHSLMKRELAFVRSQIRFTEENLKASLKIAMFFPEIFPLYCSSGSYDEFKIVEHIVELPEDIDTSFDYEKLEIKLNKIGKPVIHFKKPEHLMSIFEALEDQGLNGLMAAEFLNIKVERIFKVKKKFDEVCTRDLEEVQSQVDQIRKVIVREEERVKELESTYHHLINGTFKHLLSSKSTLRLYNDVIHVFETILSQNEVDFSIKDMVAMLEKEFETLCLEIDCFDLDNINYSQRYVYTEELKTMREARKANKILRKITRMKNVLSSAYDEPKILK